MPPVNRHVGLVVTMGERVVNRVLAGTGVTSGTAPLLLELPDGGTHGPADLARAAGVDRSHVTRSPMRRRREFQRSAGDRLGVTAALQFDLAAGAPGAGEVAQVVGRAGACGRRRQAQSAGEQAGDAAGEAWPLRQGCPRRVGERSWQILTRREWGIPPLATSCRPCHPP